MACPQAGAQGIYGFVEWCEPCPPVGYVGVVRPWGRLYGTECESCEFQFTSTTPFRADDQVKFDIVQGTFAPFAQNVVTD